MAESAKIAALRAVSSEAPQGPSGPQALVYPWMTAQGRDLVMPERAPIDQAAWRAGRITQPRRPPPAQPTTPFGGGVIGGKSVPPGKLPTYAGPASRIRPSAESAIGPVFGPQDTFVQQPYEPQYFSQESFEPSLPAYDIPVPPQYSEPAFAPAPAPEPMIDPAVFEQFSPVDFQQSFSAESYAPTAQPAPEPAVMPTQDQLPQTYAALYPQFAVPTAPAPAVAPEPVMIDPAMYQMLQEEQIYQDPFGGDFFDAYNYMLR